MELIFFGQQQEFVPAAPFNWKQSSYRLNNARKVVTEGQRAKEKGQKVNVWSEKFSFLCFLHPLKTISFDPP